VKLTFTKRLLDHYLEIRSHHKRHVAVASRIQVVPWFVAKTKCAVLCLPTRMSQISAFCRWSTRVPRLKENARPPGTGNPLGPYVNAYDRFTWGCVFLQLRYPCTEHARCVARRQSGLPCTHCNSGPHGANILVFYCASTAPRTL